MLTIALVGWTLAALSGWIIRPSTGAPPARPRPARSATRFASCRPTRGGTASRRRETWRASAGSATPEVVAALAATLQTDPKPRVPRRGRRGARHDDSQPAAQSPRPARRVPLRPRRLGPPRRPRRARSQGAPLRDRLPDLRSPAHRRRDRRPNFDLARMEANARSNRDPGPSTPSLPPALPDRER